MKTVLKKTVVWRSARSIPHHAIPATLRDFFLDPGSTTQRMQDTYAVQVKVQLLKQAWECPRYQEARQLAIPLCQKALIREVNLFCQNKELANKKWMYARAVFPADFFTGKNHSILAELDSRPLGKLLFRDPALRRSEFEIALLQPRHLEYQWAVQQQAAPATLWARRSIFWLQEKPLLLMEVFFPDFFELM